MAEPPDVMAIVLGERGHLTAEVAKRFARKLALILKAYPDVAMVCSVFGYDDTDKEIWEFPAVCSYIKILFDEMEKLGHPVSTWKLQDETRSWMAACLWPDARIHNHMGQYTLYQMDYLGFDLSVKDRFLPYRRKE